MKFYRVEDEKGQGPYRNNYETNVFHFIYNKDFDVELYYKTRPTPILDSSTIRETFVNHEKDFIFGFSSKKKLIAWFTFANEWEYFEKYGFKVSCYNVDETYKSKYQTIAKRKDLKLVKKIEFKDFIDI